MKRKLITRSAKLKLGEYDPATLTPKTRLNRFQATKYLGISAVTLWRLCKRGRIVYCRVGKRIFFYAEDLDQFSESCKVKRLFNRSPDESLGLLLLFPPACLSRPNIVTWFQVLN